MRPSWLAAAALGLALVTFGWLSTTGVHPITAAGAYLSLIVYGGLGYGLAPSLHRRDPRLLGWIAQFGLLAGAIFLGEMALEYLLLPADNTRWGQVEYGSVFLLFFAASLMATFRTGQTRLGVLAGLGSALLASLLFVIFVLGFFYTFRGTPQQAQVFRAEGNYADFANSGLSDFNVFVVEDFFGAAFFHSLLVPLGAAVVSTLGGLVGKVLSHKSPRGLGGP